jgi:ribosomal protein L11 methyltransferase
MFKFSELKLVKPYEENGDIASSFLGEVGFETYSEEDTLGAFILDKDFDLESTVPVLEKLVELNIIHSYSEFVFQEKINWNAKWEENFDPVLVPGLCYIRADFHDPIEDSNISEIVITPKMSFGTGHHSTTRLMIQALSRLHLKGASCLDMGTGTGILGIYAIQQGANQVVCIDNDEWCVTNAIENRKVNNVSSKRMPLFLAEELDINYQNSFDVIIANINRNVLLSQIQSYSSALKPSGDLLLSGFHQEDVEILTKELELNGLVYQNQAKDQGWVCLHAVKQNK